MNDLAWSVTVIRNEQRLANQRTAKAVMSMLDELKDTARVIGDDNSDTETAAKRLQRMIDVIDGVASFEGWDEINCCFLD
jgi:hypothetical protein